MKLHEYFVIDFFQVISLSVDKLICWNNFYEDTEALLSGAGAGGDQRDRLSLDALEFQRLVKVHQGRVRKFSVYYKLNELHFIGTGNPISYACQLVRPTRTQTAATATASELRFWLPPPLTISSPSGTSNHVRSYCLYQVTAVIYMS